VDFRQLLDGCGYKACTDWPPATFYKQLMEVYPDAKVAPYLFCISQKNPLVWQRQVLRVPAVKTYMHTCTQYSSDGIAA
jgi:hypothetical protein